jgi:hypothetical protein
MEHKNLEGFDPAKCVAIDKAFVVQFDVYFSLDSDVVEGVLLPVERFIIVPSII